MPQEAHLSSGQVLSPDDVDIAVSAHNQVQETNRAKASSVLTSTTATASHVDATNRANAANYYETTTNVAAANTEVYGTSLAHTQGVRVAAKKHHGNFHVASDPVFSEGPLRTLTYDELGHPVAESQVMREYYIEERLDVKRTVVSEVVGSELVLRIERTGVVEGFSVEEMKLPLAWPYRNLSSLAVIIAVDVVITIIAFALAAASKWAGAPVMLLAAGANGYFAFHAHRTLTGVKNMVANFNRKLNTTCNDALATHPTSAIPPAALAVVSDIDASLLVIIVWRIMERLPTLENPHSFTIFGNVHDVTTAYRPNTSEVTAAPPNILPYLTKVRTYQAAVCAARLLLVIVIIAAGK